MRRTASVSAFLCGPMRAGDSGSPLVRAVALELPDASVLELDAIGHNGGHGL